IEQTSRQALAEMRHLVGVLRQSGDTDFAPAPGLDQLPRLLEQFAQAGVAVAADKHGDSRRLPAGVELSAYRIIQEGLTNAVRHGAPGRATLQIRYHPTDVEIEITNPLRSPSPGAQPTSNGPGGHGLIGMHERVALYGGELTAGANEQSNLFRLTARIPTTN